jgi:phosphoribosylanthranilate isomerase
MKIKVCGMKYGPNIHEVSALKPDYMGFIFYRDSKRFVGEELDKNILQKIANIDKVGVFVNADIEEIKSKADQFGFKIIQLHGDETPEFCQQVKSLGLKVMKAFQLSEDFDFKILNPYKVSCDYFLFDTKSEGYGGTGKKFDWQILTKYDNEVPVFLSGGIDLEDAERIKKLKGLNICAIDINSRFEIEPGQKDYKKIEKFIQSIKSISL